MSGYKPYSYKTLMGRTKPEIIECLRIAEWIVPTIIGSRAFDIPHCGAKMDEVIE